MIEEVKKIREQLEYCFDEGRASTGPIYHWSKERIIEYGLEKIRQLPAFTEEIDATEPKPDESRLLTEKDFKDSDTHTLGLFLDTSKQILEAQDAKTASMLKVKLTEFPYDTTMVLTAGLDIYRQAWATFCNRTKELNPGRCE